MEVIFTIATIITTGFSVFLGTTYLIQQDNLKKGLLWFSIAFTAAVLNYLT